MGGGLESVLTPAHDAVGGAIGAGEAVRSEVRRYFVENG